jgi:hypothetical protein
MSGRTAEDAVEVLPCPKCKRDRECVIGPTFNVSRGSAGCLTCGAIFDIATGTEE